MMQNLSRILKGIGSDFDKILKMTLYFTNMERDFAAVNEVVNRYIPEHSPARSSLKGFIALPPTEAPLDAESNPLGKLEHVAGRMRKPRVVGSWG